MIKLLSFAAALLLAVSASAETFPAGLDLDLHRYFPSGVHETGEPVHVLSRFTCEETGELTGFHYSEQFPHWIQVYPLSVRLNGNFIFFDFESGEVGEVLPGKRPHRWILDDPEDAGGLVLHEGDALSIYFTMVATLGGSFAALYDGWYGALDQSGMEIVMGCDDDYAVLQFVVDPTASDAPAADAVRLAPAVPNPFNPSTQLSWHLPHARNLRVEIIDSGGRRVALLAEGHHDAGSYAMTWDGRGTGGQSLPSGLYLARLSSEGEVLDSGKLMLLK